MASSNPSLPSTAGMKRSRNDNEDHLSSTERLGKRSRPTLDPNGDLHQWHIDSAVGTPTAASQMYQQPKYDSDDQSSMISEPGSPQDVAMSSDDDEDDDDDDDYEMDMALYSQSPEDNFSLTPSSNNPNNSPWREQQQQQRRGGKKPRVATPFGLNNSSATPRPGVRPMQVRTGVKQHIRQRHPQANNTNQQLDNHLEVPSPIDEDEVPTPPSAAEAAGSQLSMLTVRDLDMEDGTAECEQQHSLPAITVDPLDGEGEARGERTPEFGDAMMESVGGGGGGGGLDQRVFVRKQRQRSGAQSNGSASPVPGGSAGVGLGAASSARRGFSMGYRADCEKCRMKVPGHMSHFLM